MLKLMILLAVSMCLAYCSQHGILTVPITQKRKLDISLVVMVIMLSLVTGLRTQFNDTYLYIELYENAPSFSSFLNSKPDLMENPLFYGLQSFLRTYVSDNANLFFLLIALFTIGSILRFIKKHSDNFPFSILLFFSLGLYVSTMASMKQCLAMAILTYAVECLIKKKYILFYVIVFIAMMFHTYAIFYAILPIFQKKPWTITTYIAVVGTILVLFTFESTITNFLEIADEAGKTIDSQYIIDTEGINLFRLTVFAVPPLLSLVFQELLDNTYDRPKTILMNMSLLSFLIMALGLSGGANLFGRSAIYFETGTIVFMPTIIKNIFDEKSQTMGNVLVGGCYLAYFAYSVIGFSLGYRAVGLGEFILSLF